MKRLASIIVTKANKEAAKEAERVTNERVKPLIIEKASRANTSAFEADFKKNIASKYPELADKVDTFKKIAFSKDFLHLKNLEAIKSEFFPLAKTKEKEVKTDVVEPGSKGGDKNSEVVDFATLKDNSDLYAKVMANPKARAKYYAWQDANV